MSLLDVKYVVTVEYQNDIALIDAVSFYTTEAVYAAALVESIRKAGTIQATSKRQERPHFIECRVRNVIYAPL